MKLQIRLYASLSRFLPEGCEGNGCPLELAPGATVAAALRRLNLPQETVKMVFVNGVHAGWDQVLQEGDALGIFPPVAGG